MAGIRQSQHQIDPIDQIKRLAVIALFSDDRMMSSLVLKGGNALDLVYGISTRASFDLDFSIPSDFSDIGLATLRKRLIHRFSQAFGDRGFSVFDLTLEEKPSVISEDMRPFWGGYRIEFKVIDREKYRQLAGDIEALRRHAVPVGPRQSTKLIVEISKHEYCEAKEAREIDGYTIFVYTPQMIVCEKLRAICQQSEEYAEKVRNYPAARARDFLDIHSLIERFPFDPTDRTVHSLIESAFDAKRVSMRLLTRIEDQRDFHRTNWEAVKATVRPEVQLRPFDFYFDFVADVARRLHSSWKV